ncbi:MAG: TetR/AcrR family transcriptional regulator C-terminal ligand-binding domain-containing protein [Thermoflexaceae bacterium]|nr:TetR/AcrR family transcriptional regulator C-terminal ligand-binding domain-containing protein [Thermoflexaceae bacterium]
MIDAAERDSELDELVQGLLADSVGRLREALVEARSAGELRSDVDLDVAVSVLAGPLFYRRLVSREVIDPRYAEQLVDHFLRGAWAV